MASTAKPAPVPDEFSLPYWEAARSGQLVVQECEACGEFQYPPDARCRRCQSAALRFAPATGRGTVYTFGVYTRSFSPGFDAPYVLALIELDDHPGVRLLTNVVGAEPAEVWVGQPVEVVFEDRGPWKVPQFRPVRSAP